MHRLTLAALLTVATVMPVLAEQDYDIRERLPDAQHPQRWKDAGIPWQDAGRELRSVWGGITGDARAIGPAVRKDFTTKPRWNWQPGTETAPLYEATPVQPIPVQPYYAPADPIYLSPQPQAAPLPYDTYAIPVETVPAYTVAPTYEMAPVYGN